MIIYKNISEILYEILNHRNLESQEIRQETRSFCGFHSIVQDHH